MTRKKLTFRALEDKDAEQFRDIRLEALSKHPEAFLGSFDEESAQGLDYFREKIHSDKVVGCFKNERLLGTVGYFVITPEGKRAHSAKIWGFYVRDEYRGRGFARQMMAHLLQDLPGDVEKLLLKVHARNRKALKFYRSVGFEIYGLEKNSLKIGDEYYDDYLMAKNLD